MRIGLDLGSTAAKAALLDAAGNVLETAIDASGDPPAQLADRLINQFEKKYGLADTPIVATGYGRALAELANKKITEITCHARGIRHLHPDATSILDIGGQDAKAIRLAQDGSVQDFAMNDRCAAGTGSFLQMAAQRYKVGIGELSAFCENDPGFGGEGEAFEISSTCVVFAESELVSLNARGITPKEALRAVHRAIARRVNLLLKQVSATSPVYFTGGVAQSEVLRRAMEQTSGLTVITAKTPQFTGAIGAALFA